MSKKDFCQKTLTSFWKSVPKYRKAIIWQILSTLSFALMAVAIKSVGQKINSFEIVFFRCLIGLVILTPFLLRLRLREIKTKYFPKHIVRALFGFFAMVCGYYAISKIPLAQATTIAFSKTLFLIPLALIILRERINLKAWMATFLGFLGVVIVMQPNQIEFNPDTLVALVGALMVAGSIISIRILTSEQILFYYSLISTLFAAVPCFLYWQTPTVTEFYSIILVTIFALCGQFFNICSFRIAETTAMAPFSYLRLVFAIILGFVLFEEIPSLHTIIGAAIIIGTTLYLITNQKKSPQEVSGE